MRVRPAWKRNALNRGVGSALGFQVAEGDTVFLIPILSLLSARRGRSTLEIWVILRTAGALCLLRQLALSSVLIPPC